MCRKMGVMNAGLGRAAKSGAHFGFSLKRKERESKYSIPGMKIGLQINNIKWKHGRESKMESGVLIDGNPPFVEGYPFK